VWNRPTRREFSAYALGLLAAGPLAAGAQEQPAKKDDQKGAEPLPGPPPIPEAKPALLPTLRTVPVRRGSPDYNITPVDASLLPRDPQNIWVLSFYFKPLRMLTVEVPGKGRRQIHYLYYRVVNRTGQPREFIPQFTLLTETGKRYEEAVLPQAVSLIRGREEPTIPVLGAVEIDGVIPPSTKQAIDDAVFGVAIWDGVDPRADRLTIYVRGLSDGHQEVSTPDGKTVTRYKTLRIDLIRRGDELNLNEREISLAEPAYEWIYW
jgi:hypothetical protein